MNDFQLNQGDKLNLRLQSAVMHQYHVVPFTFVGVVREFPTAPEDSSFFIERRLRRESDRKRGSRGRACTVAGSRCNRAGVEVRPGFGSGFEVTELGEVRSLISSSLTGVSLSALTSVELLFKLC